MGITRKSVYTVVAGVCAALMTAGCGASTGENGESAESPTKGQLSAPKVPDGFDPCVDIPQEVLDTEGLHSTNSSTSKDEMRRGDIAWSGCNWVVSDGYGAGVSATNLTIDKVREKDAAIVRETVVDDRTVVITQRENALDSCTLNAELVGGSLEFGITNPPSRRLTGDQPACDIGVRLAEKVLPLVPDDA